MPRFTVEIEVVSGPCASGKSLATALRGVALHVEAQGMTPARMKGTLFAKQGPTECAVGSWVLVVSESGT